MTTEHGKPDRGKATCVLSCLNASSFAVLIKPCWLLSMVDFLLIPRPCGKSGGFVPFLTNPPILIEDSFCPSHKNTLAQRRFPMSRKTPPRKNYSVPLGQYWRTRPMSLARGIPTMTQVLHGELPSFLSDIQNGASALKLLHLKFSSNRAPHSVPSLSTRYQQSLLL